MRDDEPVPVQDDVCPRCGGPLTRPAMSRYDDVTKVCEDCGTREAVMVAAGVPLPEVDMPIMNEAVEAVVDKAHEAMEMQNPRP